MTHNNTDKGRSLQYIRILYENRHQTETGGIFRNWNDLCAGVEKYIGRSTELRITKLLPVSLRPLTLG